MSVKFPCKMRIEHNGIPLTTEAGLSDTQKFVFNQEVTLKEDGDKQYSEVTVTLITEKGGKYIAGIMKLSHTDLIRSEGECLTIPLAKCLDN